MQTDYGLFVAQQSKVSDLDSALDSLTVFDSRKVFVSDQEQKKFQGVWNTKRDKLETIVSNQFSLIQNRDAFKTIVDALAKTNKTNCRFKLSEAKGKAWLYIVFPELRVNDGSEGIELGFKVKNSVRGDSALSFSSSRSFWKEGIEFFGIRKVCSNGMTIRVPFSQIQLGDKLIAEKIRKVFSQSLGGARIIHKGEAQTKLFELQSLIDALALSIPSIEAMILEAQSIGNDRSKEEAKTYLEKLGFGKRIIDFILSEENPEKDFSDWGLFNGITFAASHLQKSPNAAEKLLAKAQSLIPQKKEPA